MAQRGINVHKSAHNSFRTTTLGRLATIWLKLPQIVLKLNNFRFLLFLMYKAQYIKSLPKSGRQKTGKLKVKGHQAHLFSKI